MLTDVPVPMRVLGLAGLIPFAGLAVLAIVGERSLQAAALQALIGYGAVIVSFLGAIHWGLAVRSPALANWPGMAWGVIPSLLGWVALLLPVIPALMLLVAVLLAALIIDEFTFGSRDGPSWFLKLRRLLSAGAALSLLAPLIELAAAEISAMG